MSLTAKVREFNGGPGAEELGCKTNCSRKAPLSETVDMSVAAQFLNSTLSLHSFARYWMMENSSHSPLVLSKWLTHIAPR